MQVDLDTVKQLVTLLRQSSLALIVTRQPPQTAGVGLLLLLLFMLLCSGTLDDRPDLKPWRCTVLHGYIMYKEP